MKVYFIRHGESAGNARGVYTGQLDVPLTDLGREQALTARDKLTSVSFDRIYVSPLIRARETADIIFPQCEHVCDKRIREISVGDLAGVSGKIYREEHPDMLERLTARDYTPFGGECDDDVVRRITPFFADLACESFETVAVVCHGGVIHATLEYALGVKFSAWRTSRPNCMIAVFELSDDASLKLISWNF